MFSLSCKIVEFHKTSSTLLVTSSSFLPALSPVSYLTCFPLCPVLSYHMWYYPVIINFLVHLQNDRDPCSFLIDIYLLWVHHSAALSPPHYSPASLKHSYPVFTLSNFISSIIYYPSFLPKSPSSGPSTCSLTSTNKTETLKLSCTYERKCVLFDCWGLVSRSHHIFQLPTFTSRFHTSIFIYNWIIYHVL